VTAEGRSGGGRRALGRVVLVSLADRTRAELEERRARGQRLRAQRALRRLEELEPPSSDADAVAAWLAADRRVARAVRELGAAAARRDFPSVTAAASRAQLAGSRSRRAAAGLGLQVCANVGS
jgi:hypothetical protein